MTDARSHADPREWCATCRDADEALQQLFSDPTLRFQRSRLRVL